VNRLRSSSVRTWLSGLVLAALFALQTLGAMHGVLHAGGHHDDQNGDPHAHAHGIAKLFGGHAAGGADCQLYDQLAHGDVLAFAPALLPAPALSFAQIAATPAGVPAVAPRFFQARGPPATA
jgi:hypothetical protein